MENSKSYLYNLVRKEFPNAKTKNYVGRGSTKKYWKNLLSRLRLAEKKKIIVEVEREFPNVEIDLNVRSDVEKWRKQLKELKESKEKEKSISDVLAILRKLRDVNSTVGRVSQYTRFNHRTAKGDMSDPFDYEEVDYLTNGDLSGLDEEEIKDKVGSCEGLKAELKKALEIVKKFKFVSFQVIVEYGTYGDDNALANHLDFLRALEEGKKPIENDEDGYHHAGITTISLAVADIDQVEVKINNHFQSTDYAWAVVGYHILVINEATMTLDNYMKRLRAYAPSVDQHYHELTACSTTKDRLCIYQTYLYLYKDKQGLKKDKCNEFLEKEPEEVKHLVKGGELMEFCKIKSKELNETIYIEFFHPDPFLGVSITGDDLVEIKNPTDFDGKKVFLYDSKHVAPRIDASAAKKYKSLEVKLNKHYEKLGYKKKVLTAEYIKAIASDKEKKSFSLKPSKAPKIEVEYVSAYDFETYTVDETGMQKPFCCCLKNPSHIGDKSFYGANVIRDFCDYIDTIKTETYMNKSNPKNKTKQIVIYGFNNSRFDNIFLFNELQDRNPKTKYTIHNGYKYIKYHNIRFYDLNLYYAGTLNSVARAFKLPIEKDIYPYTFVNRERFDYIGNVPDIKYWNKKEDREEYIKLNGNNFDMKTYTVKYCMKDSELAREIALKHLEQSHGEINGKEYDVRMSPTGAGIALKLYSQVFLKSTIYESAPALQKKEREAYKGGRTEVFKKKFSSNSRSHVLKYIDLNSSYPYAMTKSMPIKFIKTMKVKETEDKEFTDYFLYFARSEYIGNDKHVIPNLLIKSDRSDIIATLNTEYAYHWGCELNEAVKNGFKVYINEINEYAGAPIFKEFAEYMYNERLKVKKTNTAKAEFFKLCMNSLYGKFGQKEMINNKICSSMEEMSLIANNVDCKIRGWEVMNNDKILLKYSKIDDSKSIGSLVRFASCIAGYARSNLSSMMRALGHEHVYYCDTDSIFTDVEPPANMISQTELGKWKEESCKNDKCPNVGKPIRIKNAEFLAPKLYSYEAYDCCTCNKAKGQPSNQLKREFFENLSSGKIDKVEITNDKMFIRTYESVKIISQTRTMQSVYNKRIWEGNNSKPYKTTEEWYNEKYN